MTIAIGFACSDGIVLATDTQYTTQYVGLGIKREGPKLFVAAERSDLTVIIAAAGSVPFMKMAVGKLKDAFDLLISPSEREVQQTVEDVLLLFFKAHIYPVPNNRPQFSLLIGARIGTNTYRLWETESTSVVPVASYACIGAGETISQYALKLVHGGSEVADTMFTAAFAVKAAKDHVNGCGGPTKLWTLTQVGIDKTASFDMKDAEEISDDLFQWMRVLLIYLSTEGILVENDDGVRSVTDEIGNRVLDFRNKQRAKKEKRRKFVELQAQRRKAKLSG